MKKKNMLIHFQFTLFNKQKDFFFTMPTSLLFLETNICQRSFKRFLGKSIIFTLFRNIYFTILTNNLTRKLKKNRRIMNIIEIDLLPYLWKLR